MNTTKVLPVTKAAFKVSFLESKTKGRPEQRKMHWPPPSYTILRKSSPSASCSSSETEEHLSPSYREDYRCIIKYTVLHAHLVKLLPIQLQSQGLGLISSSTPSTNWREFVLSSFATQRRKTRATAIARSSYLSPRMTIWSAHLSLSVHALWVKCSVFFSLITNCFFLFLWLTWCLKTC